MKRGLFLVMMLGLVVTASGCAENRTRIAEGAGIGGALGAIAGGIIGHQSRSAGAGVMLGGLLGAATGAAVGAQIENSDYVPPTATAVSVPSTSDIINVKIPRDNGTYTVVVLKRVANGYIGPQGEFYPEFPRMDQLKAMYG